MTKKNWLGLVCLPLLSLGCGLLGTAGQEQGLAGSACDIGGGQLGLNSTGKVPEGCTRIEGGQIGQLPQTVSVGGETVTFTGWTAKDGEPGEFIAFEFTSTGPMKFAVKTGGGTFVSEGTGWSHPAGTAGPEANAISNVTFCKRPPDAPAPDAGTEPVPPEPTPTDGGTTPPGPGEECPVPGAPDAGTDPEAPGTDPEAPDAGPVAPPPPGGPGDTCSVTAPCGTGYVCVDAKCQPQIG